MRVCIVLIIDQGPVTSALKYIGGMRNRDAERVCRERGSLRCQTIRARVSRPEKSNSCCGAKMADYDAYDEATLQRMVSWYSTVNIYVLLRNKYCVQANEAESYEERSAIRQALRRKKKDRGENVGRVRARGNSVYNRFAGSTATTKQLTPKNYVIGESESTTPARPVIINEIHFARA